MYLGKIVEMANTDELFAQPAHPYTMALLSAVPKVDVDHKIERIVLKGDVPSPLNPKPGCRFAPRCFMAQEKCFHDSPELLQVTPDHFAACHFADKSREAFDSKLKEQEREHDNSQ